MLRTLRLVTFALCLTAPGVAGAQPLADPVVDASAPAPLVRDPAPVTPRAPSGPAMKERGARTRRANPASGVLFVAVLVGAMGYWVVKRFKR